MWEILFLNLNCSDKNSLEISPVVFFGPGLNKDEVYWKSKTLYLRTTFSSPSFLLVSSKPFFLNVFVLVVSLNVLSHIDRKRQKVAGMGT